MVSEPSARPGVRWQSLAERSSHRAGRGSTTGAGAQPPALLGIGAISADRVGDEDGPNQVNSKGALIACDGGFAVARCAHPQPPRPARPQMMWVALRLCQAVPARASTRIEGFCWRRLDAWGVFALALAARLGLLITSGRRPIGDVGYDASVYYAAADALIHGRMPYTDFVLLHPPGLMLALAPFAALGWLTTDHAGFVVASTTFAALGALNAVLVLRIAGQAGLPRAAALLGGVFYAVWLGAVGAEISGRLEPLGNFALLCGILALVRAVQAPGSSRLAIVAGVAFGVAPSVKIWYLVPVLLIVGWHLVDPASRRPATRAAASVAITLLAIDGPFFARAPGDMWQLVVADQLGRAAGNYSLLGRLDHVSSVSVLLGSHVGRAPVITALASVTGLALVVGAGAWQVRRCRVFVVLAGTQVLVLLLSPSYFGFYSDFLAPAASLLLAAAASAVPPAAYSTTARGVARVARATAAIAVVATATAGTLILTESRTITPLPARQLASRVRNVRCLIADSPMALIELNTLSRGLGNGCPNWVDISGRTYGIDAPADGRVVTRMHNQRWQIDLRRYLLSGDAFIVIRSGTGVSAATRTYLDTYPTLARSPGYVIRRSTKTHQPHRG